MKTTSIIAAVAFAFAAAAGAAHAQEATYELPLPAVSAKSRAAVLAEVQQARAAGTLNVTEAGWPQTTFVAQKTRAEVHAETLAAIASGELRRFNQEPYGSDDRFVQTAAAPAATVTAAR